MQIKHKVIKKQDAMDCEPGVTAGAITAVQGLASYPAVCLLMSFKGYWNLDRNSILINIIK